MSQGIGVSREYRIVAALFELIEGRRSVRDTVDEMLEAVRGLDTGLDRYLADLDRRKFEQRAAALKAQAEERRAEIEAEPDAAARSAAPLAEVVEHPSARRRRWPKPLEPPPAAPPEPLPQGAEAPAEGGSPVHDYSAAFAAVSGRAEADAERVSADRTRVARELKRLLALRPRQRAMAIRSSQRRATRSPLLVEGLLDEACRVRGASPRQALELTEAAILAARKVHPRYGRGARWRAEQRAEAHRANVLRLLGELPAADAAWCRIHERTAVEPVDVPDELAELLSLEASLRIDLRQFDRAEELLERAERLYRQVGERVGLARVLLKRGSAAKYAGESRRACAFERRAAELLDPESEPSLFAASQRNLAHTLVTLHHPSEASELLAAHHALFERHDDPADRLRRRWIEARIARTESRYEDAERLSLEVRNGWLSCQRPYDAALATLDLVELDLERADWRSVKRRAALLAPVFEARGVHREAKTALILFEQAVRAEQLTATFIVRLRRYLLFARRDPRLRFDPGADPARG